MKEHYTEGQSSRT